MNSLREALQAPATTQLPALGPRSLHQASRAILASVLFCTATASRFSPLLFCPPSARRAASSASGWSPRSAAKAAEFVVRAAAPNCVLLKPERGAISLTSIPDLHGAIMGHIGPARASREGCSEADYVSQLWSNAIVRPLSKFYFRRTDASDSISYHIPAAESIEIEFTSRMAVSAAIKLLAAAPLKLPCIVTPAHSQSKRAPSPPASPSPMLPSTWEISLESLVATAAVPQSAALFLTEHAKQRMRQRGISPSDVADAVSKGRATRSSKQNMNFQTKIAVTAFKPEAKQDFAQRQAEADELKKAQSKTFVHRKRGWAMRRQVTS